MITTPWRAGRPSNTTRQPARRSSARAQRAAAQLHRPLGERGGVSAEGAMADVAPILRAVEADAAARAS